MIGRVVVTFNNNTDNWLYRLSAIHSSINQCHWNPFKQLSEGFVNNFVKVFWDTTFIQESPFLEIAYRTWEKGGFFGMGGWGGGLWSEENKKLYWKVFFFSSKGHSNTVCEMRVAWVWLFQKASACYCLASHLLQAPVPWVPYMRDQGLPRCYWESRGSV